MKQEVSQSINAGTPLVGLSFFAFATLRGAYSVRSVSPSVRPSVQSARMKPLQSLGGISLDLIPKNFRKNGKNISIFIMVEQIKRSLRMLSSGMRRHVDPV
jgi:hypothetical protein